MNKKWIALGCLFGFLSVVFGAFGAHVLTERLDNRALNLFHTGAEYQMYHSLALLGLGVWERVANSRASYWIGGLFTTGIILFSGSLYALALTGIAKFGFITPLGGLSFMFGWLVFGVGALQKRHSS